MWEQSQRHSAEPEEVDLLLLDATYVVTCDSAHTVIPRGGVAVRGGRIVEVGTSETLRRRYLPGETVSLEGCLLMPGLVNAHTHAPMSLFRGLADDLPLDRWLHDFIFPTEARWINPDTVYLGSLLSFGEMLLGGITCFCDGYFFEEEVLRAACDAGMRGIAGQGVLDFPTPDAPDRERALARAEALLDRATPMVKPSLFCHAPYTCSAEMLTRAKALCRERGALFQIHLAETMWERDELRRREGMSPTRWLADLGVLDENTLCVHGVWLDDEDEEIVAASGAAMVHCVESNLKLGSGVARLPSWLERGMRVAVGTDSPASNNNHDLLREMGIVAMLHKGTTGDPTVCSAQRVVKLATVDGATALGLGTEIGSIERGKRADCVALSLRGPHAVPLYDPIAHIVYVASSGDVRWVWVEGRMVVREGSFLSFPMDEVLRDVRRIATEIRHVR